MEQVMDNLLGIIIRDIKTMSVDNLVHNLGSSFDLVYICLIVIVCCSIALGVLIMFNSGNKE